MSFVNVNEWKLTTVDPQEWSTWRSGVRSAMHAVSQLPGRGPTDVDDMPLHLHVNQKSDYDDDDLMALWTNISVLFPFQRSIC